MSRRWPYAEVQVVPVLVQGDEAAAMLVNAVNKVDAEGLSDVIIIGRGGGSIEDLWAFNDENLARAIFACKIPVISAVGHETDFTICDFVSDMRAPTPSAAAELATPDRFTQLELLSKIKQSIISSSGKLLELRQNELEEFARMLKDKDPALKFTDMLSDFDVCKEKLVFSSERVLSEKGAILEQLKMRLFALNPAEILRRGYSVVTHNDKTVTSKVQISSGDKVKIILSDGDVTATVD